MITFQVTLVEERDGVRFTVGTPDSKATMLEADVAREFMRLVTELGSRSRHFKTAVEKPWSQANDPSRQ